MSKKSKQAMSWIEVIAAGLLIGSMGFGIFILLAVMAAEAWRHL